MDKTRYAQSFITEHRIQFAVNVANELAEKNRMATAYDCAEMAVHKIFGRWLKDYSGATKPGLLPVYLRLVADVEQRMGLHRRRKSHRLSGDPAMVGLRAALDRAPSRQQPSAMVA